MTINDDGKNFDSSGRERTASPRGKIIAYTADLMNRGEKMGYYICSLAVQFYELRDD